MGNCYEDRKVSFGPYIMWARTRCSGSNRRATKTENLSRELQNLSREFSLPVIETSVHP
jgi:hypothetical protein